MKNLKLTFILLAISFCASKEPLKHELYPVKGAVLFITNNPKIQPGSYYEAFEAIDGKVISWEDFFENYMYTPKPR